MRCGSRVLNLETVNVMGILNITPDSFSDGAELYEGGHIKMDKVLRRAQAMVKAGATILDVGGESTRPGADPVSAEEEERRVLPVVEKLGAECDVVISVDTSAPRIMRRACGAGAGLINDVRALQRSGALEAVADSDMAVCLTHMRGEPGTMQENLEYKDIVGEVAGFLRGRVAACERAGISRERVIVDPGFGFGKSDEGNLTLVDRIGEIKQDAAALLLGVSRKSTLRRLLGDGRLACLGGALALAVHAARRGARIIRTHDVGATVSALRMLSLAA